MTKPRGLEIDPKVNDSSWHRLRHCTDEKIMSHVLQHITWRVDDGGLRLLCDAIPLKGAEENDD